VPIVGRNNRNFTHNVLWHQKNLKGCLLFPLIPSLQILEKGIIIGD
jgi:hypothetical protein